VKTDLIIDLFLITKECMEFLTNDTNQKIVLDLVRDYLQTRQDFIRLVLYRILDPDEDIEEKGTFKLKLDVDCLLSVFQNHSSFTKEYHTLLSEQLLNLLDYKVDEQVFYL
jgi:hypothetical protein